MEEHIMNHSITRTNKIVLKWFLAQIEMNGIRRVNTDNRIHFVVKITTIDTFTS